MRYVGTSDSGFLRFYWSISGQEIPVYRLRTSDDLFIRIHWSAFRQVIPLVLKHRPLSTMKHSNAAPHKIHHLDEPVLGMLCHEATVLTDLFYAIVGIGQWSHGVIDYKSPE